MLCNLFLVYNICMWRELGCQRNLTAPPSQLAGLGTPYSQTHQASYRELNLFLDPRQHVREMMEIIGLFKLRTGELGPEEEESGERR
jgi:hypothetical protein